MHKFLITPIIILFVSCSRDMKEALTGHTYSNEAQDLILNKEYYIKYSPSKDSVLHYGLWTVMEDSIFLESIKPTDSARESYHISRKKLLGKQDDLLRGKSDEKKISNTEALDVYFNFNLYQASQFYDNRHVSKDSLLTARTYYQRALSAKPQAILPANKLAEIEMLLR